MDFTWVRAVVDGTRWGSWLRHCATSRKVAGSTGMFHWHNPPGRTVALASTGTSNRNEYQEYFLGGKGGRCVGLTTLPPSCADCLEIREFHPPGILRACPGQCRDCCYLTVVMIQNARLLVQYAVSIGKCVHKYQNILLSELPEQGPCRCGRNLRCCVVTSRLMHWF